MSEEKIASGAEVGDVVAVHQDEELEIVLVANEKPDPKELRQMEEATDAARTEQ